MRAMSAHRHVFFIGGFDPKSPRYTHRLFRALAEHRPPGAEGASAGPVAVGARITQDALADTWTIGWPQADGTPRETRVTQLRWDDIVRRHWARSAAGVWRDHRDFYGDGWRQGNFGRLWRASRANWLFAMYPLAVSLACMLLAAALTLTLVGGARAVLPGLGDGGLPGAAWQGGLGVALGLVLAWWLWRHLAHRLGADWLLRLYGFSHAQAEGRVPALDERIDAMAGRIAAVLQGPQPPQEVLVIGHSVGATLAASAMARALARPGSADAACGTGPEPALLTLGHCTPLVYFHDTAQALRDELDALTAHARLTWVDYTAPADWAACARMSPWHRPGAAVLHRLSPRFPRLLTPARYRALRRNRLAMHMQYLKPADHAGSYDLLALAAGPSTLRQRHPPPSRLATP